MNIRTVLGAAVAATLSLAAAPQRVAERAAPAASKNAIHVIAPYKSGGTWAFDDPRRGSR